MTSEEGNTDAGDLINHEIDHLNEAREKGVGGSLIFMFGFDGEKDDGELIQGTLSTTPAIHTVLPNSLTSIEKARIKKEITGAPKNYLSEGDKAQLSKFNQT